MPELPPVATDPEPSSYTETSLTTGPGARPGRFPFPLSHIHGATPMPTETVLTHLILGVVAGLPAILLALGTLMQVLRQRQAVARLHDCLDEGLDKLLPGRKDSKRRKGPLRPFLGPNPPYDSGTASQSPDEE